jgi:hypothetical protein
MTTPDYSDVIVFDDGGIRRTFRTQTRALARAERAVFDSDGRKFAEICVTAVRLPDGDLDEERPSRRTL